MNKYNNNEELNNFKEANIILTYTFVFIDIIILILYILLYFHTY